MSVAELKDALREALERRGVLNTLRANVRSEVFQAMEDVDEAPPSMTGENLVINELIREYLAFNNYKHSLSVFSPEVGLPPEPLRRQYVAQQTHLPLHVGSSGRPGQDLPLLYALVAEPVNPAPTSVPAPDYFVPPPAAAPPQRMPSLVQELAPPPPPMAEAPSRRLRHPGPTPVIFTADPSASR